MDMADLRVFEMVARTGAMNRAASRLNTVQSNVTARIRALEQELDTRLFDRHSRGVHLTPAGQRLLPYARELARVFGEARHAVDDDGAPKGPLLLGALETTTAIRLSPLLAAYAANYPRVDLTLRTGTTEELVAAVLDHDLEGAFVCGPVDHPDLEQQAMFREELAVATPPAVRSFESFSQFRDLRIVVLRVGCSYRQRLEEVLARRGIVGLRRLEFGTIDGIIGCVGAGLGVTLMPTGILAAAQEEGRIGVHRLAPADAIVETVFIRRRGAFRSSAQTAFVDHVLASGRAAAIAA